MSSAALKLNSWRLQEASILRNINNIENGFEQRREWLAQNDREWTAAVEGAVQAAPPAIRAYANMLEQAIMQTAEKLEGGGVPGTDGCVRAVDGTVIASAESDQSGLGLADGGAQKLAVCERLRACCDAIEGMSI